MDTKTQMVELKVKVLEAFDRRDGKATVELFGAFMEAGNTKATQAGWLEITHAVRTLDKELLVSMMDGCIELADPNETCFMGEGRMVEGRPSFLNLPVPSV
jgi:hypothetical protein